MADQKLVPKKGDFKVQSDVIYAFQLVEQRGKILGTKPENWDQQEQSRFTIDLSDNDVGLLLDFEDGSDEDRRTLLQEQDNGQRLAAIFLKLVENVGSVGIKKYFLARIDEILSENRRAARYFHECKDPFGPFLGLFRVKSSQNDDENELMCMFACRILSFLFGALEKWYLQALQESKEGQTRLKNMIDQPLNDFIFILNERARSKNNLIPLKALKDTLKLERAHEPFLRDSGIRLLSSLMEPGGSQEQVMYLAGFCTWMVSFNERMLREIDLADAEEESTNLIKNMVGVVKSVQREKVVRICFSAFRNMLKNDELKERMVGLGLVDMIKTLDQSDDSELKDNVKAVGATLKKFIAQLSTFEKYAAEVTSGQLQRSAVHNEAFWRKNSSAFEKGSYKLIRQLVGLLDSKDATTLEMACYDLGEFARFHPDGRGIISRFGGKSKIMRLMASPEQNIAKQALLCVQKLMVTNWEFLTKSSLDGSK